MAAFLAGAINSVAGGGTLISFPALIWLGLNSSSGFVKYMKPNLPLNKTLTLSKLTGALLLCRGKTYRPDCQTGNQRTSIFMGRPRISGRALTLTQRAVEGLPCPWHSHPAVENGPRAVPK